MQPYINKWKICHFISHMLMYPWNVFIIQYTNQKNYKRAGALKKKKNQTFMRAWEIGWIA